MAIETSHPRHCEERGVLLCLYGIVRAGDPAVRSPSHPLQTIVHGRLAALVEPVSAEEYRPERVEANLASVEWVSRAARRHEELLEAVMLAGPVIPARLCTLFSGREAVCRLLAEHEEALVGLLDRLAGREERGIKIYCDEVALRRALAARDIEAQRLAEAAEAASPGQAYVLTRRRDQHLTNLAEQRIEQVQDWLLDVVEALDIEVQIRPTLVESGKVRTDRTVLHLAALVDAGSRAALDQLLDDFAAELQGEGFSFEQSGPWPPYSFARSDGEDVDAA